MIEAHELTKRYGDTVAVDHLSFAVSPGRVTGFLGPNGAGKSTTMRLILGLDAPTAGSVTVDGGLYTDLRSPLRSVGALLDPKAIDPKRTAANHLRWLARSNGIATTRVDEVLGLVGLADVAGRRVGAFSLGMGQRLGLAAALLGDPPTLLFDEPINGLDPEGIVWMRTFLRDLADEGRTVFLSSHLMSEMAQTADHLVVIGRGRLIIDASTDEILATHGRARVRLRAIDRQDELASRVRSEGADVTPEADGAVSISGLDSRAVGQIAAAAGIALAELVPETATLEEAFFDLTHDAVAYRAGTPATEGANE